MWTTEHTIETTFQPEAIWQQWIDVAGWKKTDPGVVESQLHGDLRLGATGRLKPKGGPAIRFVITNCEPLRSFIVENGMPLAHMAFEHEMKPTTQGTQFTHRIRIMDLRDVTLVGNDLGLFQVTAGEYPERIARLVITSCEAFENIPPGLPGHTVAFAAKLPGGLFALTQPLRLRALRRLPLAFGWMAKRPIPHEITDAWLRPLLTQRKIRRDLLKYLHNYNKGDLLAAAEGLRSFDRPALIIWAAEDRVMPPAHGRRLAALLPRVRLVEIPDSYTLIPEDQPAQLTAHIRAFIASEPVTAT